MKEAILIKHMQAAMHFAELSSCQRRKVGCVIVKDDRVISMGYNGTPKGWDNECEDEDGNTYDYVLHAETNALSKLAISTESSKGAWLFATVEPCIECAKLIAQCGIERVYFFEKKTEKNGTAFLKECGIESYRFLKNPLKEKLAANFIESL